MKYKGIINSESGMKDAPFVANLSKVDTSGRFAKNPISLGQHDLNDVIGKWEGVNYNPVTGNLEGVLETFSGDENFPGANKADAMFARGVGGFSYGLIPRGKVKVEKETGRFLIEESVLYEASVVSVPMDENAVVTEVMKDATASMESEQHVIESPDELYDRIKNKEVTDGNR